MAVAPLAAPAPAEEPLDAAPAEETEAQPVTVLTVMRNPDGTYSVQSGDEPEPMEGEEAPAPETYTGIGPAMAAILKVMRADAETAAGEGTADENFDAGYKGGSDASPAKPMPMAAAGR